MMRLTYKVSSGNTFRERATIQCHSLEDLMKTFEKLRNSLTKSYLEANLGSVNVKIEEVFTVQQIDPIEFDFWLTQQEYSDILKSQKEIYRRDDALH